MPAVNWAFLCDYAFVDSSGKASIIGIFDNLKVRSLPTIHGQMFIALEVIIGMGEEFDITTQITSPTGNEVAKITVKGIRSDGGERKSRLAFGFYHTKLTEIGEHHVELFINNQCIHTIPFMVHLMK